MLRKHIYFLTALAIAILTFLTAWLYSGKPHYPIVRSAISGDVTLTFVGLPWNDVRKCEEAQKKVVEILRAQCAPCQVLLSECRQQLDPSWEKALRGEHSAIFAVHTDTQRIMIEAKNKTAHEICVGMATQIKSQGQQAKCVAALP